MLSRQWTSSHKLPNDCHTLRLLSVSLGLQFRGASDVAGSLCNVKFDGFNIAVRAASQMA
jgi:hypothetical protein